jgi:signal transduction histidine kinase
VLEGSPLLAYTTRETRATLLEHLRLCRLGELPSRADVALPGRDGNEPTAVEIHSHCRVRDPGRLFTTLINLTDRNRAEAERRRVAELEAVTRAQDQFISQVSHELRTPIAPIANLIEVLKMRADLSDELRPILEIMERNVWLEVRLIDDLLDITRIRRDKLSINKEPLDLHDLLRQVEQMLADDYRDGEVALTLRLEAGATRLQADPTRVSQVFWNLLGNALKFTQSGGTVSVRTLNPAPDQVRVLIEDDGAGMQAAEIDTLFEPFVQNRDGYKKGLGLGLAIARGIVAGHGGAIEGHSDGPGKGSTFVVTLPLPS